MDKFEEIKKYKDLFDCGVLTKAEFEEKKQIILGLKKQNENKNENLAELEQSRDVIVKESNSPDITPIDKHHEPIEEIKSKEEDNETSDEEQTKAARAVAVEDKETEKLEIQEKTIAIDNKSKEKTEKEPMSTTKKIILFAFCGLFLLILILSIAIAGDEDSNPTWTFNPDNTKSFTCTDVTAFVPDNWDLGDCDDSYGKATFINENGDEAVWFVVSKYNETFDTVESFKEFLEGDDKGYTTTDATIENATVAYSLGDYYNVNDEHLYAYAVLVGENGYWIAGGGTAETDNVEYSESNFEEMIQACEITSTEKKESPKTENKSDDYSGDFVLGDWHLTKIVNYKGDDLTDQEPDLSIYTVTFNKDGTGILHDGNIGDYKFTWKPTGENSPKYEWTVGDDTGEFWVYNDPLVEMDISCMKDIFGDLTYTFER